jgi:putative ABC transport system permease protein
MIKNYLLTALRHFRKDKLTLIISLTGLAAGMACCMLILIFISDELSFNRFNTLLDRIYTVNWVVKAEGQIQTYATTPIVLGPHIPSLSPAIEGVARLFSRSGEMQSSEGQSNPSAETRFQEQNIFFTDPDIFRIFTIPFLKGNRQTALHAFNSIVITDEMARKYFGQADPLGKSLLYENQLLLRVEGVVQKMPANSDIQFDFLISFESLFTVEKKNISDFLRTDWTFNPCYTFLLLKPGRQPKAVLPILNQMLAKSGNARNQQLNTLALQPFQETHLYSSRVQGGLSTNSITYLYLFAGIALLILLIANVNFINLAIARSVMRTQEVGMRRLLGAGRTQLVVQLLLETLLISALAFIFALALAQLGLPVLNELTNKQLSWEDWLRPSILALFSLVFFLVALAAGLYPALYITRLKPVRSIQGKSGETGKRQFVQKFLLVSQFTISLLLISGALIIYQQLQFLRNKPLGFQKDQMIVVPIFGSGASSISYGVDAAMRRRMNEFADELTRYNRISGVTTASAMPGQGYVRGLVIPQGFSGTDNIFVPWVSVDYNFLKIFHIPLVAGRDFSKSTGTDHLNAFLINESALQRFGWKSPGDAIGKAMIRGEEKDGKKGMVIGVIRDFNFNTLDQPMQPLIMDVNAPRFTQFAVNILADHIPSTISFIRATWKSIFPERVFEYSFLDKDIQALYRDKENLGRIIEYFALIAILLSGLGLFSLASFLSVQRTREIGIRKVLGATIGRIVIMLSADYLKWVLIAILIASPLSYWIMHKWLENFAYRIEIKGWVFVLSGAAGLIIAWLTVGFQATRTALTDPVKSLRTE